MRKVALVLMGLLWSVGNVGADDSTVGKKVAWEPAPAIRVKTDGERLETPNQRRRRLGLTAEAAPVVEYGEQKETPNQQRKRLAAAESIVQAK